MPGGVQLVNAARLVAVYRAVQSLERKGILVSRRDAWGRKIVRLAHDADRWRPGQDVPDGASGPVLCARCGMAVAGEWIWRPGRAALPRWRVSERNLDVIGNTKKSG